MHLINFIPLFYFALMFKVNSFAHIIRLVAISLLKVNYILSISNYAYKRFFPVYHNFGNLKYLKFALFIPVDEKQTLISLIKINLN